MSSSPNNLAYAANGLAHLDPLLQHRARLGACVLLSTADALTFSKLKELLQETDGNLGANLRKLEDENYLSANKQFIDRKPVTAYALTKKGRAALKGHLAALELLIRSAQAG